MRKKIEPNIAYSIHNGICFCSGRYKGYIAFATINEEGMVTTSWKTAKKIFKDKKSDKKRRKKEKVIAVLYVLLITLLCIKMLMINPVYSMRTVLISYALWVLSRFIVEVVTTKKQGEDTLKFHSAEHMVINAFDSLKRVPTLEEIRQYSRFSNFCGVNEFAKIIINISFILICTFMRSPIGMLLSMLIAIGIVEIAGRNGFLNFLQIVTLAKPTDRELMVAIEGMKLWFKMEKEEEKNISF